MEKGSDLAEDEDEEYFNQEGHHGDCIVNVDGTVCSELMLSFYFAGVVKQDALICLFFDMCRTEQNKVFLVFVYQSL